MLQLRVFVFFVVGLFDLATAQVPFPNQCPNVTIPKDFDVDAYMGIWYEHSKYPFIFEFGKKCMYARYDIIDNQTVSVVNAAVSRLTGTLSNITGKAKIIAPGQLAVVFSKNQNYEKPNYLVLGTDYTSYSVVYSCSNFTPIAHTKIVWILTRERKPKQEIISAAKKIMDDNNLSKGFLLDTTQNNCPESNTKTDDEEFSGDTETDTTTNLESVITTTEQLNMIDKA